VLKGNARISITRQSISIASHDPYCEKLNLLMGVMLGDPEGGLPDVAVFVFVFDVCELEQSVPEQKPKVIPLMTLIRLICAD
jgi:hypothetical protein